MGLGIVSLGDNWRLVCLADGGQIGSHRDWEGATVSMLDMSDG